MIDDHLLCRLKEVKGRLFDRGSADAQFLQDGGCDALAHESGQEMVGAEPYVVRPKVRTYRAEWAQGRGSEAAPHTGVSVGVVGLITVRGTPGSDSSECGLGSCSR
jgi:hypothetical protein